MLRKTLLASSFVSVAFAGSAAAAQAPTAGHVTIIKAGQKVPIAIAGNHLAQGATIRKGTEVRRRLVTMHGASKAKITLSCGPGGKDTGLGVAEEAKLGFALDANHPYGHRTLAVRFFAAPHADPDTARASIYAVCTTA